MLSLHIHTPQLFHVELGKDGWEYVDVLKCQSAKSIELHVCYHKVKSALTCTVLSQCTPVPDGQTDEHHGNSATCRCNECIER